MVNRVGQVWWVRRMSTDEGRSPHVVLRRMDHGDMYGWIVRPLERIAEHSLETGFYEFQFRLVETGSVDVWIGERIA